MCENYYGLWNTDSSLRRSPEGFKPLESAAGTCYVPFETSFFRKADSYLTEEEIDRLIEEDAIDSVCVQITCLVAAHKYLTKSQIAAALELRGLNLSPAALEEKMKLLLRCNFLRTVECRIGNRVTHTCYCTGIQGNVVAKAAGVYLHRGNAYMSRQKRMQLNMGVVDEPYEIKRVVQANNIILSALRAGLPLAHYGVAETLRMDDGGITDSIVRTTATLQIDRENHLMVEVVRKNSEWESVWNKLDRFSRMIARPDFLERVNVEMDSLPQLIICGEDDTHNRQIYRMLENRGILAQNPELTVLFTTDQQVARDPLSFYAFGEEGEKLMFSLQAAVPAQAA